ncbi:MAG: hypothetical protein WDM96_16400 [Lacunisphaera sp.]
MQTRVLTLTVAASRAAVFNFLADIEHLPAWTGGFCEWIELHREGWWAYTAVGELAVEAKADDIAGEVDLRLRHVSGWMIVIPLRVRSDGEGGALVSAACNQPAGLSDDQYEELFESLLSGLRNLATRFPSRSCGGVKKAES